MYKKEKGKNIERVLKINQEILENIRKDLVDICYSIMNYYI